MKTAKNANLFMLITIIYQLVAQIALSFYIYNNDIELSAVANILISQFCIVLPPVIIAAVIFRDNLRELFPFKKIGIVNIILIVLMSIFVQPFMGLMAAFTGLFFSNNISEVMLEMLTDTNVIVTVALISLLPAFIEEIAYRGVLLSGYNKHHYKKAAFVSGLFFGMMHLDLQQFLYAFVLGTIFSLFVHYTKSLWASVIAHLVINGSQALLLYVSTIFAGDSTSSVEVMDAASLKIYEFMEANQSIVSLVFYLVVTLFTLPIFLVFYYYFVKRNKASVAVPEQVAEQSTDALTPKKDNIFNWSFWVIVAIFLLFSISMIVLPLLAQG